MKIPLGTLQSVEHGKQSSSKGLSLALKSRDHVLLASATLATAIGIW